MSNDATEFNEQITYIDSEIDILNTRITDLQSQGHTGPAITACVDDEISKINTKITDLTEFKTELQSMITNIGSGWSVERQAVIDEIEINHPEKYTLDFQNMLSKSESDKAAFFTPYSEASTDFLKNLVLEHTFGISE